MKYLETIMDTLAQIIKDKDMVIEYYRDEVAKKQKEVDELKTEVERLNNLLNPKPGQAEQWPKSLADALISAVDKDYEAEKGLNPYTEACYD